MGIQNPGSPDPNCILDEVRSFDRGTREWVYAVECYRPEHRGHSCPVEGEMFRVRGDALMDHTITITTRQAPVDTLEPPTMGTLYRWECSCGKAAMSWKSDPRGLVELWLEHRRS